MFELELLSSVPHSWVCIIFQSAVSIIAGNRIVFESKITLIVHNEEHQNDLGRVA